MGGAQPGGLRALLARLRAYMVAPVLDEIGALRAGHAAASVALGRVTPELVALRERQDRIEPILAALEAGQQEARAALVRATDELALMRDRHERAEAVFAALRETLERGRETLAVEMELGQDRLQLILERLEAAEAALRQLR